jgi:hypothetical protein
VSAYDLAVHYVVFASLAAGLGVGVVGVLGWLERLPRNRFFGVRTQATLRDERTFRMANKIAGPPLAVAGVVGMVGGAVGLAAGYVIALIGLAGMVAIAIAGGVLGHRAAEVMPAEEPELPAGCRGCQCGGCDIAKSIRGSVGTGSVGTDVSGVRGE